MKRKLHWTIFSVALSGMIFFAGCTQREPTPVANNASVTAPQQSAMTSAVKRAELTRGAAYKMDLQIAPQTVNAQQAVTLDFAIKDQAEQPFDKLKIVHEKSMHLLVVSDDLAFFEHVHPEPQTSGDFKLKYEFPTGGTYKLYADFTPENAAQIINVFDVAVGGAPRRKSALVADPNLTKTVDGLTFTLKNADALRATQGAMLNFYVTDADGKPVTDLQPYLGAMAHFVVISEDTTKFLHVHAMEGKTTAAHGTGAHGDHNDKHGAMEMSAQPDAQNAATPTVMAHTEFPTGGLYKLWAQFQRDGKVFTVPFVFNVAPAAGQTAQASATVPPGATKITVSGAGYEPSSVNVKKGQPVKLAFFRKDADNCGGEVVFPQQKIRKTLPVGETVLVEFTPQSEGEITFSCGMKMLEGKIVAQ